MNVMMTTDVRRLKRNAIKRLIVQLKIWDCQLLKQIPILQRYFLKFMNIHTHTPLLLQFICFRNYGKFIIMLRQELIIVSFLCRLWILLIMSCLAYSVSVRVEYEFIRRGEKKNVWTRQKILLILNLLKSIYMYAWRSHIIVVYAVSAVGLQ